MCRSSSRGAPNTRHNTVLPPPRLASSARRLEALVSPAALLTEHGVACLADAVCALLQGRPPDHLLRLISGQSRVISGHLGAELGASRRVADMSLVLTPAMARDGT